MIAQRSHVARIVELAIISALFVQSALSPSALNAQTPPEAKTQAKQTRVQGVIFGADGLPLAEAKIIVGAMPAIKTSADGSFALTLGPGMYAMRVEAPGYNAASVQGLTIIGQRSVEVMITLRRGGQEALVELEGVPKPQDAPLDEAPTQQQAALAPGKIAGKVVSLDKRRAVEGARVYVRGLSVEATTGPDGRFILEVPSGEHQLSVIHPDFSAQSVPGVEVRPDEQTEVPVELSPVALELDDFTVTAPRIEGNTASLLNDRKEAATMNEVLGAEQFSKSGDSSAASALKRVTGLTVVGGKYVYVRGLGERYSSTLLNGATLPSPEPEQRVVPLDMFPTSLLESVTIQKTYSPDKPGEFGGGVVSLQTRSDPSEFQASMSLSLGYVTGTTLAQGQLGPRGSLDWLGFDDGSRALPALVRQASARAALKERGRFDGNGYTAKELATFGRAMPNNWGTSALTVPPNMSLSATIGDKFTLLGKRAGLRAGVTYSNGWDQELSERTFYRVGANSSLEARNSYGFDETNNTINGGIILTGSLALDERNTLKVTSMVSRVSDDEGRVYRGFNRDAGAEINVSRLRWLERMLLYEQILGTHKLNDQGMQLDWRYVFSQASRSEPDLRESRYDYDGASGDFLLSDLPEGNSRLYSELTDNNHDLGADYTMPFKVWSNLDAKLKTGAQLVLKSRQVDTRRFKYFGTLANEVFSQRPDQIFTAQYIGEDQLQFGEITRPTDNYEANQKIFGVYAMTDLPVTQALMVQSGVRVEYSDQVVRTFELFNPDAKPIEARLSSVDVFPAINATLGVSKKTNVRAALSRTVSRPDFREMSPAAFTDVAGGSSVEGNPELERGLINHGDLRWEWYPGPSESVSVSAFGKYFQRPIEMVLIPGAQRTVTFQNAQAATNFGLELEARKGLDFVSEQLRDLYVSGNLALIRSRVQIADGGTVQTSTDRALQGQSPYVVNVQAGYDNAETNTSVSVLYNVFGPRIMEVGALGAPDIYERPFHQVDVVASRRFGVWRLGLRGQNLLDLPAQWTQGAEVTEQRTRGRAFSLTAGLNF